MLQLSSPLNSPIHLENPEFQTRWYFKYFMGKRELIRNRMVEVVVAMMMIIMTMLMSTTMVIVRGQT